MENNDGIGQETTKDEFERELNKYPVTMISIDKTVPYKHHPFKLCNDSRLETLAKDIKEKGLLNPIIVRKISLDGICEILSGHRRVEAAKMLAWTDIGAYIVYVTDPEASRIVVQSNFQQRDKILTSERAKSYKLRYEYLILSKSESESHGATDDSEQRRTIIAKEFGESASNVYRYLRLNYLIDDILDLHDKGQIRFLMAVDLSHLTKSQQEMIYRYFFVDRKATLKTEHIKEMRKCGANLSTDIIDEITARVPKPKKISLDKLFDMYTDYFGDRKEAERIIFETLQNQLAELKKRKKDEAESNSGKNGGDAKSSQAKSEGETKNNSPCEDGGKEDIRKPDGNSNGNPHRRNKNRRNRDNRHG